MAFIGTHKSVTGERGFGFFKIFSFFYRTQKKTVSEQAKLGIKYFDLGIKRTNRGWICASGKWETQKSLQEILKDISKNTEHKSVLINITYEGKLPKDLDKSSFVKIIKKIIKRFNNLCLISISEEYKKIFCKREKTKNIIWERNVQDYKLIEQFSNEEWKKSDIDENEKTIIILDFYDTNNS